MSGEHGLPTASVVRSSQATPARRRGQPCAAVKPAEFHLSHPDSCSNGWGHLCRSGIGRAFYCFVIARRIVVVHAFIKKSQQTPDKELKLARKRAKELTNG